MNLQKSIARLSSGKRIEKPTDDAGGMAVAMKLESQIMRSGAAMQNMLNGVSLLEVQDGVLSNAGQIVDRMSELSMHLRWRLGPLVREINQRFIVWLTKV